MINHSFLGFINFRLQKCIFFSHICLYFFSYRASDRNLFVVKRLSVLKANIGALNGIWNGLIIDIQRDLLFKTLELDVIPEQNQVISINYFNPETKQTSIYTIFVRYIDFDAELIKNFNVLNIVKCIKNKIVSSNNDSASTSIAMDEYYDCFSKIVKINISCLSYDDGVGFNTICNENYTEFKRFRKDIDSLFIVKSFMVSLYKLFQSNIIKFVGNTRKYYGNQKMGIVLKFNRFMNFNGFKINPNYSWLTFNESDEDVPVDLLMSKFRFDHKMMMNKVNISVSCLTRDSFIVSVPMNMDLISFQTLINERMELKIDDPCKWNKMELICGYDRKYLPLRKDLTLKDFGLFKEGAMIKIHEITLKGGGGENDELFLAQWMSDAWPWSKTLKRAIDKKKVCDAMVENGLFDIDNLITQTYGEILEKINNLNNNLHPVDELDVIVAMGIFWNLYKIWFGKTEFWQKFKYKLNQKSQKRKKSDRSKMIISFWLISELKDLEANLSNNDYKQMLNALFNAGLTSPEIILKAETKYIKQQMKINSDFNLQRSSIACMINDLFTILTDELGGKKNELMCLLKQNVNPKRNNHHRFNKSKTTIQPQLQPQQSKQHRQSEQQHSQSQQSQTRLNKRSRRSNSTSSTKTKQQSQQKSSTVPYDSQLVNDEYKPPHSINQTQFAHNLWRNLTESQSKTKNPKKRKRSKKTNSNFDGDKEQDEDSKLKEPPQKKAKISTFESLPHRNNENNSVRHYLKHQQENHENYMDNNHYDDNEFDNELSNKLNVADSVFLDKENPWYISEFPEIFPPNWNKATKDDISVNDDDLKIFNVKKISDIKKCNKWRPELINKCYLICYLIIMAALDPKCVNWTEYKLSKYFSYVKKIVKTDNNKWTQESDLWPECSGKHKGCAVCNAVHNQEINIKPTANLAHWFCVCCNLQKKGTITQLVTHLDIDLNHKPRIQFNRYIFMHSVLYKDKCKYMHIIKQISRSSFNIGCFKNWINSTKR